MGAYWVEEHLWAEEPLIADIDVHHVAVDGLVNKVLKLLRLNDVAVRVRDFIVILLILLQNILAHVAIFLLDL